MMPPENRSTDPSDKWSLTIEAKRLDTNAIVARTSFPPDSFWFSGHFPGEPILPGVAQIALVEKAIQQVYGKQWHVAAIKRTRFKQIIEPDDEVGLLIEPQPQNANTYLFQISSKGDITASGIVVMKQTA